uniref:DDE Tnp4 domain-containing protein n=1 Tax=Kwoniella pini CBS 10737 TaxID=1296096 RepID=A0A1B9HVR3_9TREE|nr:uncharacterized protein I206_06252 [Kwoniella pini CBS 10737]OCF47356.1 hypothetical protein I206_06252 [Kwoniella pini CBS 10737]
MGGLKSKDAFERDLEYSLVDAISFDDDDLFDDIAAVYLDSKLRRYLCRPSRYLKHRERDFKDRIDRLHREPDEGFRKFMRINKLEFNYLLTTLQDHPIFKSTGKRPQAVPKYQITVAIWRLGHDGTGASAVCINQHFHIAEGTCNIWTDRFIYALLDLEDEVILWPDKLERREIADQIAAAGVPGGCVGFVDGCLIVLDQKPSRPDGADFFSYKGRYGVSIMCVCDDQRRIRYLSCGFPGCSHDNRVFETSYINENFQDFFSPNENILRDSAYRPRNYCISLFKRGYGEANLAPDEEAFNIKCSSQRVAIEHTYGLMKGRWQSLRGLRIKIRDGDDECRVTCWIRACVILHNLFISTSFDFYTEEEAKQAARREELEQQQRSSMDPHHRQDEAVYHPARLAVMHLMGLQKSIKPKKKKKNQTIVLPPGINLIDYIHPNLVLPITNVDCS